MTDIQNTPEKPFKEKFKEWWPWIIDVVRVVWLFVMSIFLVFAGMYIRSEMMHEFRDTVGPAYCLGQVEITDAAIIIKNPAKQVIIETNSTPAYNLSSMLKNR